MNHDNPLTNPIMDLKTNISFFAVYRQTKNKNDKGIIHLADKRMARCVLNANMFCFDSMASIKQYTFAIGILGNRKGLNTIVKKCFTVFMQCIKVGIGIIVGGSWKT